MSRRLPAALLGLTVVALLAGCAAEDESATGSPSAAACDIDNPPVLTDGTLTVGTDKPAYPPYFVDDDPSNGKGFESAVAYAVAEQLGFTADQVTWVTVPFNSSYAPGTKNFDFDINQISITPEREEAVSFSDPYYTAPQAVVALEGTPAATATSISALQDLKIGVQVGTTSLQFVTDTIQPTAQPQVFNDTAAATAALKNKQIDAIVVDLPTAGYITEVELDNGTIVGQFPTSDGGEWGLLTAKDSPLLGCLNEAIGTLTEDGTLEELQQTWLPFVSVPEITQ